ncbi:MAG: FHA domain-containing protein, partial [Gammaproteobacteria bacterium]|nr:FHA domain-containing protein [Gammaproteobacteria bacterium]
MLLKLEVVGAQAGRLGEQRSKVFATEGGTIGRIPGNDWVLPDQFVSSRHAAIQYADGQFYVIDTNSSNGVFLNAPNFRLEQGRPYPINSGDRLLIDPFDIQVSVVESPATQQVEPLDIGSPESLETRSPLSPAPASVAAASSDPFAVEEEVPYIGTLPAPSRRGPAPGESIVPTSSDSPQEPVDPLVALGLPKPQKAPPARRVEDLASGSPLRSNFELPRITPRPPPPEQPERTPPIKPVSPAIPLDYNPLAQTDFDRVVPKPPPAAPPPAPPPPPRATPAAPRASAPA